MKNLKTILFALLVIILLLPSFPGKSEAHRGALDKLGGHFNNADCSYLLHSPTSLAKQAKSKTALLSMIKTYSSNSCKNKLIVSKIFVEGGLNLSSGSAPVVTPNKPAAPALNAKYSVTLFKCIDGDTADFKINGKVTKSRFLFIDTPESTIKKERFGKEASNYTCNRLRAAKKITLELDGKDKYDKYGRLLAWVWVDGKLLQEDITKEGLVKGFYDYGTYRYENRIRNDMAFAKKYRKGMYK